MKRIDLKRINNLSKKQIEDIMNLHQIDVISWNKKIDIKDKQISRLKDDLNCLKKGLDNLNFNQLKQDVSYWKEKYQNEIKELKFKYALENRISISRTKDPVLLKRLLDMNKLAYHDNKLWGIDDQIKTIKQTHPCLFL